MRFRLLRRRLTISAPRVAIRSAMPWPLRWLSAAVVLGLCGAVALWAFEFGKSIAGLDSGAREELQRLRAEVAQLREENHRFQDQGIAAESLRTAEGAASRSGNWRPTTAACVTTWASSRSSFPPPRSARR
jgi:hypothetical protein